MLSGDFFRDVSYTFIGGICTVILLIVITFTNQHSKRMHKKDDLNREYEKNQDEIGDIEEKLDTYPEYRTSSIKELIISHGLHPLLITEYACMIFNKNNLLILLCFITATWIFMHENFLKTNYKSNNLYAKIITVFWLVSFVICIIK